MKVPLYADLTEEQKLELGMLLDSPPGHQVHELIAELLVRYEAQIARVGLRDEKVTRDWLVGYLDCAAQIQSDLDYLVMSARNIAREKRERGEILMGRIGGEVLRSEAADLSDALT